MPALSAPRPGPASRTVAATLALALTWGVFSAVVSIGAQDRERLMLASAARQGKPPPAVATAEPTPEAATIVAVAGTEP